MMAMVEYHQASLDLVQTAAEAGSAVSKGALTVQRAKVNSLKGKVEHLVEALAQEQTCSGKEGASKPQHDALKKEVVNLYEGMLASAGTLPAIEGARAAQECQLQQASKAQAALLQAQMSAIQNADKADKKAELVKRLAQGFAARCRTRCETLQQEKNQLTEDLSTSIDSRKAQSFQLKTVTDAKDALTASNEGLHELLSRVEEDLKAKELAWEAAQEFASARQAEVTSLEQQLATSQADLEAEQSLKVTLQADVQSLQVQLKKSQQLATELQASKDKAEEQRSQKTAALNTKTAEVNTLQQSLKRAEEELIKERGSRAKANQTNVGAQREVSMLTARLAEVRQEIDAKQDKLEIAERQIVLAEKERKVEVAALAASLKEREENESKLGALQAQYIKMVAQNQRLECDLKKMANTQESNKGLGLPVNIALSGPTDHCVQAPLVYEAGRKDKQCSQGFERQHQVEAEEEDDFEEEEDEFEEEEATSSGKGQVGPSSQGPTDGSPSGLSKVPDNFKPLPKIAGFSEQLYLDQDCFLGWGNTGAVYASGNLHQLLQGRPQWAVKVVNPPVDEADRIDRYDVDKELASLDLVAGQPRLLQYRGYSTGYQFEDGERVLKGYMMTDLLGPSLTKAVVHLDRISDNVSSRQQRLLWVASMFKAVRDLHSLRVVHHDIKVDNFCLRSSECGERNLVLIDMGLLEDAKGHDHNTYTPTIGTTEYHAPELLDFTAPDELRQAPRNAKQRVRDLQACDVWAAAVVAFFVMTGTDLYYLNCDGPDVQEQVLEQQKALLRALQTPERHLHKAVATISKLGPHALEFFFKTLRSSPRERITAAEALRHDFLANAAAQLEKK